MSKSSFAAHLASGLISGPTGGKGFAFNGSTSMLSQVDVFTIGEIARAAGVPRAVVQQLVDTGALKPVQGSSFFDTSSAVRAARQARQDAATTVSPSAPSSDGRQLREQQGLSAIVSSLIHITVLAALLWSTSGVVEMATAPSRAPGVPGRTGARGRWRRGWASPQNSRHSNREAQADCLSVIRARARTASFEGPGVARRVDGGRRETNCARS
jgi:hypothetical protein